MSAVDDLRPSIALITSAADENTKFGTAFSIYSSDSTTMYLTCAHVVRDVGGPAQLLLDGAPAAVVALADAAGPRDLAVIKADHISHAPPLQLNSQVWAGDAVSIPGFHSFGRHYLLRHIEGSLGKRISLYERNEASPVRAWDLVVMDDDSLLPGFSGAPVLHKQTESIVAVVSHSIGVGDKGVGISLELLPDIWPSIPVALLKSLAATSTSAHAPVDVASVSPAPVQGRQPESESPPPTVPSARKIVGSPPLAVTASFRGRERELQELLNGLHSYQLVGVVGHGGTGKTALACRALLELEKTSNPFGAILYHTAANIAEITLESVLASLGKAVGLEQQLLSMYGNTRLSVKDRIALVLQQFERANSLTAVLLDNFEKYQDDKGYIVDDELASFISLILTKRSSLHLLLTTRVNLRLPTTATASYCQVSTDKGLDADDAVSLLRDLDPGNMGGLQTASEATVAALAGRAGYYPRALEVMAGLLREDLMLTPDELTASREPLGKEFVKELVRDAITRLGAMDTQVLQILAVLGEPAPIEAVLSVSSKFMDRTTVGAAMRRLVDSHYASYDKTSGLFSLHPIDRAYAYTNIPSRSSEAREFCRERLALEAAHYYASQRKPKEQWQEYDDLKPQLREFHHLVQAREYVEATSILNEIDVKYLINWGYVHEALALRRSIEPGSLTGRQRERHFESLGAIYKTIGYLEQARQQYEQLVQDDVSASAQARTSAFNQLSRLHRRMAEYGSAREYSKNALESAIDDGDDAHRADALGDLASISWCEGQYDGALPLALEALDILRQHGWKEKEAHLLYTLARILLSGGRPNEAETHLLEALRLFRASENLHGQAIIHEGLAEYSLASGAHGQARRRAETAIELSKKIGNLRGEGHGLFIIAKIALAERDANTAREYATKAGFVLRRADVPEAQLSECLGSAMGSLGERDDYKYVESLLKCAYAPANAGDLVESRHFATLAADEAERLGFVELALEARAQCEELMLRMEMLS